MSFFRQHRTAETPPPEPKGEIKDLLMSDGTFCLNDKALTSVVSVEATTEAHEKEFAEHISYMGDAAAAQLFTQYPDL
jgi:hypothetical protein